MCYVKGMKLTFDKETGAAYLKVSRKRINHGFLFPRVRIDCTLREKVVGVEIFDQDMTIIELRKIIEGDPDTWWRKYHALVPTQ